MKNESTWKRQREREKLLNSKQARHIRFSVESSRFNWIEIEIVQLFFTAWNYRFCLNVPSAFPCVLLCAQYTVYIITASYTELYWTEHNIRWRTLQMRCEFVSLFRLISSHLSIHQNIFGHSDRSQVFKTYHKSIYNYIEMAESM